MRWTVAFLLLLVSLSGCSESPEDPEGAAPAAETAAPRSNAIEAPQWSVGDYWTYTFQGGTFTYIVTDQTSNAWIIDTDDHPTAFFHAQEEISMMGEIRSSDLAGSQGTDKVLFFDWPLRDGKTWKTPWDGEQWTMKVNITDGVATTTASQGDFLGREFTYRSEDRWFSSMTFYNDDGSEQFTMELTDSGSGWTGDVHRYTLETVVQDTLTGAGAAQATYDVAEGITDLWAQVDLDCEGNPGKADLFMAPVGESAPTDHLHVDLQCPAQEVSSHVLEVSPGQYALEYSVLHDSGDLDVLVYARTLETITI